MQSTTLWCLNEASMSSCTCAIRLPIPLALKREKLLKTQPMQFPLIDYARYNENFVLVVTSSCCIRWDSMGYQGPSPWLVSAARRTL